ncbi:MAG: prepilin peptidase, partial [Stellaceae bacterium]
MTATSLAGWVLIAVAPIVGSFLGVVIRRVPDRRSIVHGRSRCEACGAALAPRDLVPLASWLATRGRCRHCGAWLGGFYPAVELAALALAAGSLAVDRGAAAWLDWGLGCWLLALGWIDLRRWLLPDLLTLPLVLAGLAAAAALDPGGLTGRALGAALGYLG